MNPKFLDKCKCLIFFILLITAGNNAIAQHWDKLEDSSHPRVEAMNALVDDKIYIFSGFTEFDGAILKISSTTEVFDPLLLNTSTGPWSSLQDMPIPVTHVGAVVVEKTVWFPGGFAGNDPGASIREVQIFDTQTNTWSMGPELPEPMASHAVVRSGTFIHVFGGLKPDRKTDTGAHYVLDLQNQKKGWLKAAQMPHPRNHLSAATLGGKIYAIGGQFGHDGGFKDQRLVHEYDPLTDLWARKADLPLDRSHFEPGTISVDGKIIIVGGRNNDNKTILANITEFDPIKNKWSELTPLPHPLLAPVAKVINDQLFVTHGGSFWNAPLKSAFVKKFNKSGSEKLSFSPQKIDASLETDNKATKKTILWTLNTTCSYTIDTEKLPNWIKLNPSEPSSFTDPAGKYIDLTLDATGLAPGKYIYVLKAEAQGLPPASLPITLYVTDPYVIRINSGGGTLNANGALFQKDAYFNNSKAFTNKNDGKNAIEIEELYLTERSPRNKETSFSYSIPVPNGKYMVRLHFAEIYWGAPGGGPGGKGKRIFDVNLEGGPIELQNYDIFNEVGAMAPSIKDFEVLIEDGNLDIEFSSTTDQPKVSAIEILPIENGLVRLWFEKKIDSVTLKQGTSAILENKVTASDNEQVKIWLSSYNEDGDSISWISMTDIDPEISSTFTGSLLSFHLETSKLQPGKYKAEIFSHAENYSAAQYQVYLTVLPAVDLAIPQLKVQKDEFIFSSINDRPSEIQILTLHNVGTSLLTLNSISVEGNNAEDFKILNLTEKNIELEPQDSLNLEIQFLPLSNGLSESSVIINSNDPELEILEVKLYGLSSEYTLEKKEPTLMEILQTLGYNIDIGFSEASHNLGFPIGDGIPPSLFIKSGTGDVKIQPVARYSQNEPLEFGFFNTRKEELALYEVDTLSDAPFQNQTLFPKLVNGVDTFDPLTSFFGIYIYNREQMILSFDSLPSDNAKVSNITTQLYPVNDRNGKRKNNQFLIAFDNDNDGDFQDYVFLLSNVKPAQCLDFTIALTELINPQCTEEYGIATFEAPEAHANVYYRLGEDGKNQSSSTFNDLLPGTHTVYAFDVDSGCEAILEFTIEEPQDKIEFSIEYSPISCGSYEDGSLKIIDINGGEAPYLVMWNHITSNAHFQENLVPGNYNITVVDAKGCRASKDVLVKKEEDCNVFPLYRETFGNNSNENMAVEEADWTAYSNHTSQQFSHSSKGALSISLSTEKGNAVNEYNINAGTTTDSIKGFLTSFSNEPSSLLIYTEEFPIDINEFDVNSFTWMQGHDDLHFESKVVIKIDDVWYISKKTHRNTIPVTEDDEFSFKAEKMKMDFSLLHSEWDILHFVPGDSIGIRTWQNERNLFLQSLPRGIISAFGIFTSKTKPGTLRFDTFTVVVVDKKSGDNDILVEFNAELVDESFAHLFWKTVPSQEVKTFTVERSSDNVHFEEIGLLDASTENTDLIEYNFKDSKKINGTAFYRLKFRAINDAEKYSGTVSIGIQSEIFTLFVYPNPISETYLNIELTGLNIEEKVTIKILDIFGRNIMNKDFQTDFLGNLNERLYFDNFLPSGIYKILTYSSNKKLMKQFIVQ